MKDLKHKTIRGGLAQIGSQVGTTVLRLGTLMIMSRILEPKDFGLIGMVAALIGVCTLLKDFGLSTASIQRVSITNEELSSLFWLNVLVGAILSLICLGAASFVAAFYHDPRLVPVTSIMACSFLFNGAGVQHSALLQRQMRFPVSSALEVIALFVSSALGVGLALAGFGYWALAVMTVAQPIALTIGLWLATGWIPGRPHKTASVLSMMRFGGTITVNALIVYIGQNLEKVLLGRFWGASALGLYGRAYQLISIPTENLNSAIGGVAFSALSRLQTEPERLKSYFLKGYSLVLAMTTPITIACALLADDMISVVLGPKWHDAAIVFRLLAPTVLVLGCIKPLAWLLCSVGLVGRSLKIALVLTPVMICGYVIGLPYGPKGVALGYSVFLSLWVVPHIAWCVHGTIISFRDICLAVSRPLISGLVAAALTFAASLSYGSSMIPIVRLGIGGTILVGTYVIMLLFVMGQKPFYFGLLRGLRGSSEEARTAMASA